MKKGSLSRQAFPGHLGRCLRGLLGGLLLWGHFSHSAWALHVVLDPGHGGRDLGATRGDIREAELALKIAQMLADKLDASPQFRVTLTRNQDHFLSLDERVEIATQVNGDLFLSLHLNSSPDPRARGVEFYFRNQLPPDEEAMALAARENEHYLAHVFGESAQSTSSQAPQKGLQPRAEVSLIIEDLIEQKRTRLSSELARRLDRHWQGGRKSRANTIRQAPFRVIAQAPMPSALVELGFISHPREAQQLTDRGFQKRLVEGLFRGLQDFKEVLDKDKAIGLQ